MREDLLFDPLISHLEGAGYTTMEQHRGLERGVDITATKDGRKLYVQLKGDTQALDVDFGTNLYQLMKLMDGGDADYAIGVSEAYKPHVQKCGFALGKLGVWTFLVKDSGAVETFR